MNIENAVVARRNGQLTTREKDLSRRDVVEPAAKLMKAMGNRHRLTTLFLLSQDEYSVGALNAKVGLSGSGLSQHLAILRRAGLVRTRREAQTLYYSLAEPRTEILLAWVLDVFGDPG